MLRITTADTPRVLTMRLEGRFEGEWVMLAVRCWRNLVARSNGKRLCVDLTDVTFISPEGKTLLAEMHKHGAQFLAEGLMNKAIVAEIQSERAAVAQGATLQK